jgi:predicted PurR-regulated permease PerM
MTVQAAGAISVAFAAGMDRLRRLGAARRRSFSAIALAALLVAAATLSYLVAERG